MLVSSFMTYESCELAANHPGWVNPTEETITDRGKNLEYLNVSLESYLQSAASEEVQVAPDEQDEKNRTCSCSKAKPVKLDIDCYEIKQFCFEHACTENQNWKLALERSKQVFRPVESENLQRASRSKKPRLTKDNCFLNELTLKKIAEIVSKPSVVDFIKNEIFTNR